MFCGRTRAAASGGPVSAAWPPEQEKPSRIEDREQPGPEEDGEKAGREQGEKGGQGRFGKKEDARGEGEAYGGTEHGLAGRQKDRDLPGERAQMEGGQQKLGEKQARQVGRDPEAGDGKDHDRVRSMEIA